MPPHDTPPATTPAPEVRLSNETLAYLESRIALAVAAGLKNAVTEDTAVLFWSAGLTALRKNAAEHTGRFVLGGLRGLLSKLGLFLALGSLVYALGGWSALAGLWKALFILK